MAMEITEKECTPEEIVKMISEMAPDEMLTITPDYDAGFSGKGAENG